MPLRILHTADAHLGAKFLGLGEKGRLQRSQLLETFEAVVDLAIGREVNLFLVAGDLFDSNRVPKSTLTRVASRLEKLAAPGIRRFLLILRRQSAGAAVECPSGGGERPAGLSVYMLQPLR